MTVKHALIERSTQEEVYAAKEASEWLLDAVATVTQNRMFLEGDDEYDSGTSHAIKDNGLIACLRAIHSMKGK